MHKKILNILSSVTNYASKSSLKSLSNLLGFVANLSAILRFLIIKSFKDDFSLLIDGEKLILNRALDITQTHRCSGKSSLRVLRSRPPLPTPENFDVTQTWGGPGTGLCLPRVSGHREPSGHCDKSGQESERVGGSPGLSQGREVAQPRAHCPQHILLLSAQLFTPGL